MPGLTEGRVAIVTGAGRGIGRGHALELARQGAKVVVNDLGTEVDGRGSSEGPAGAVVDEIRAAGGEAVANGDDVSDWDGAGRLVADGRSILRFPRRRREQCGHFARPDVGEHVDRGVGCGHQGASPGHLRHHAPLGRVLA